MYRAKLMHYRARYRTKPANQLVPPRYIFHFRPRLASGMDAKPEFRYDNICYLNVDVCVHFVGLRHQEGLQRQALSN